jgi:murein L,D-transpeptidase YcbB/YkuD
MYETALNNRSKIEKRLSDVQRQIEIQREAHTLIPKDIDNNETITYYRRESQKVEANITKEKTTTLTRIETIESKCKMAIEIMESDIQRKIEALEAKRDAEKTRLNSEANSKIEAIQKKSDNEIDRMNGVLDNYSSEIERVREKLEDSEPQSQSYRKMKADLVKLQEEEKAAEQIVSEKLLQFQIVQDKHSKSMQRQAAEEYQRVLREQQLKDDAEREKIELMNANKEREQMRLFNEAAERANTKRRNSGDTPIDGSTEFTMKAIENAYPKKIPRIEKKGKQLKKEDITIHSAYSTADLATLPDIDYEVDTERYIEIYEKLWRDAWIREKRDGWWQDT